MGPGEARVSDCISCGLTLPAGARRCPACGTGQELQLAGVNEARCSMHAQTLATAACARCGRFMCVECSAVDAGVCRSCLDLVHREVQGRLASLSARAGWVAVLQGLLGPALAFRSPELFWFTAAIGAFSVVFGLITVARRELWIASAIACGLMGFISFFALVDTPLLVLCLVLAIVEWRLITRAGPLEREAWVLRKP